MPWILLVSLPVVSAGCAFARERPATVVVAPTLPPEWTQTPTLPSPAPRTSTAPSVIATSTVPTRPAASPTPYPTGSPVVRNRAPVELTMVQMFSESEGWGIEGASILTTLDGGRTWRDVTPPDALPGETRVAAYGGFLNAYVGWMIFAPNEDRPSMYDQSGIPPGASVWYTSSSGRTWNTSAPLDHTLFEYGSFPVLPSFSMVDSQTGWLRLSGGFVAAGPKVFAEYFHTIDGGATWDHLSSTWCPDVGSCYSDDSPGWVSEMGFINQNGWILVDDSGCGPCYGNQPAPAYWLSVNGGSKWRLHTLPSPQAELDLFDQYWQCYPQQLNLLNEEVIRLVVACWDKREGSGEAAYLYASGDGGASWDTHPLPPELGSLREGKTRMLFITGTHGLLLGREMFRTSDGGATWRHINTVSWDGQFNFVDLWLGWAVARSGDETALVYTENGSEAWQILNPVGWP